MAKNSSQHLRKEKKKLQQNSTGAATFLPLTFRVSYSAGDSEAGGGKAGSFKDPHQPLPPRRRALDHACSLTVRRRTPAWSQRAGCTGAAAAGVCRGGGQVPEGTGPAVSPKMQVQGQLEGSLGSHAESPCHPKSCRSNKADAPSWRATASAVNKGQRSPLGHCH